MEQPGERGSAREVAAVFLRLGATAFGGPAAHIGMFRQELVVRRNGFPAGDFGLEEATVRSHSLD